MIKKQADLESMQFVLPIAAMALGSYGGFTLANKLADLRAKRERQKRIEENMNKLGKVNLELMNTVRKTAGIGDYVKAAALPFGVEDTPVPGFMRAAGKEATFDQKLLTKAMLMAGLYGGSAFGIKYLLSALERKQEAQKGNRRLEASVQAGMPVISPDPSLRDYGKERAEQAAGITRDLIEKEAEERQRPTFTQRLILGIKDPGQSSTMGSLQAALALLGVTAFGAGAVLTKQWADERDPNRQRIKAAEKAAERMALQERPPVLIGAIDPRIKAKLDAHINKKKKVRPRSVNLIDQGASAGSLEDQIIDPTDTLARNVAVV